MDLQKLNKQIKRPIYPTSTPKDVITNIDPKSIFFTPVNAKHGYWQIPLDEVSQDLTTFITLWGRYKFLSFQWAFPALEMNIADDMTLQYPITSICKRLWTTS